MKKVPLDSEQEFTWNRNTNKEKEVSPFLKNKIKEEIPAQEYFNKPIKKQKAYDELNDKLSKITFHKENKDHLLNRINIIHVLIGYLHLLINSLITVIFIYIILSLFFFIKRDINTKVSERKAFIKNLSEEGAYNYKINKCDPRTRVPALTLKCTEWEVMMNRKIDSVEVTKIVLEVLGESLDGFVRRFSLKSCFIFALFFSLFMIFRNVKFGR